MRITISYLVVLLGLLSVPQFASAQSGLFSDVEDTVEETTDTMTGEKESEESSSTSSSNTPEDESTKTDSSSEQEGTSLTDDVTEEVDETIKDTKDTADSTLNNVEDTGNDVTEKSTSDPVETVDQTVEETTGAIEDTVEETTKTVTDKVDETTEVVDQVTETVENQVDDTTETVEGVTTSPDDTVNKIVDEAAEKIQDSTSDEKVTEPELDKNPKKDLPGALIPKKEPRTKVVIQKDSQDHTTSDHTQSLKETKGEPQRPVTPAPIPNKDAVVPNPSQSMQKNESQQNVNGSVHVYALASKPTDFNQSVVNVLHGKASLFFTQWMNAPPSEPPQISSFLPNV